MTPTRILILGGRGCIGRQVARACRALPDVEVAVAGRRQRPGVIAVDLDDSANLKAFAGFDFVVNCTDARKLPPDRAAAYCLHDGGTYIEMSADPGVLERLWSELGDDRDPTGRVVLGGGLFPGISNLLAADLAASGDPARLEVVVRWTPFSFAGRGTCRTMADAFGTPAERIADGRRWRHEPLRVAGDVPMMGRSRPAISVGLAEARMLHWSTGVPSTGSLLVSASMPRWVQRLAVSFAPWRALSWSPVRWLMTAGAFAIRGGLFRWRDPSIEIAAVVDRGLETERSASVVAPHALRAVGGAAAAIVAALRDHPADPGVHTVDQAIPRGDVWSRLDESILRRTAE